MFPITERVVAPYWSDGDTTVKGFVRFSIITNAHPTLSCMVNLTSDFISSREGVNFEASWLLVARWIDICPYLDTNCTEVTNKQVVMYSLRSLRSVKPLVGKQFPGSGGHQWSTVIYCVHLPVWKTQLGSK